MPRLFTGIEVPEPLARELALMRGGLSGARWVEPEDFHITLRFLGDIDEGLAREVYLELWRVRREPIPVTLGELSFFGGERPRALIVKVQPSAELIDLQAEHERIMRRIGLAPETRKFTPHVTLARLRGTSSLAVADYLSLRGLAPRGRYLAEQFVVYSSRDSVGGGPYVIEAEYPLGEPERTDEPD
jgi:2'-5' RNA ligase